MKVSVVVLAKNEEQNIERCLKSVALIASEIYVVNDESTDKTAEIAKANGAQVLNHAVQNDFAQQRNWAMEQVKSLWILFVDADEVVSPVLQQEILHLDESKLSSISTYNIPRHDFWQGREITLGEVFTASSKGFSRLVHKGAGAWEGTVHERWEPSEGQVDHLHSPLLHYPHQTVTEFLEEINRYSSVRAQELFQQKKSVSIWQIWLYPLAKFFVSYFLLFGFLQGAQGFIYSFMMSFHSFLVRAKLYQYYHINPPVS